MASICRNRWGIFSPTKCNSYTLHWYKSLVRNLIHQCQLVHNPNLYSSDSSHYSLLHAVVFCRPTGRSLLHIARFLHKMSTHNSTSTFLQSVCKRATPPIILSKHYQKIIFTWKTCTLQMYGACLQTEFLGFQPIEPEHFELLADLTELTILLLQNCAKIPVHWMLRQNSLRPCSCYGHLVCASIVLLHRCFKYWTERPKCMDLKVIARLAKLAIVSVHDNFVTHCESVVLLIGGTAVKQRLHSVFYWILQHKQLFNLDNMHGAYFKSFFFWRNHIDVFFLFCRSCAKQYRFFTTNSIYGGATAHIRRWVDSRNVGWWFNFMERRIGQTPVAGRCQFGNIMYTY